MSQGTFDAAGMSEDEPRRADDRAAAPAGVPGPRHAIGSADEVCLEVSGLRGDRFGPIDLEVSEGEILGIAGAEGNGQVQFLRALAGVERATGTVPLQRQGARLEVAARRAPGGGRAAERRPSSRVAVPRAQRPSEHDDSGAAALRPARLAQPPARAPHGRRSRERLKIRTASIEQPVLSLSGGNQQKVSLTRPFLRGDVRVDPRRRADPGRRRRLALRHLRRAAREGERRRGDRSSSRAIRSSSRASATASSSCRAGGSSTRSPATS